MPPGIGVLLAVVLAFAVVRAGESGRVALLLIMLGVSVVALVIGSLERLFLAILLLDIPARWDKHFNYHLDLAALGAVGGYTISATTVALVGLYTLRAIDGHNAPGRRLRLRPALPLAAYISAVALSLLTAQDRELGAFQLMLLVQTLLVFIYVANAIQSKNDVTWVIGLLVGGLFLESVVMLAVGLAGIEFNIFGLQTRSTELLGGEPLSRVGGTVGSANGAAAYVAMMIPVAVAVLWADVPRWLKRMAWLALPVATVALILTYSRGGWAAAAAALLIVIVIATRRGLTSWRVVIGVVICACLIVLPFRATIESRLVGETQGVAYSANARLGLMRLSWEMIEDRPFLGVGANNFAPAIETYAGPDFTGEWLRSVHNTFLLTWAEAGVLALAGFLWFLIASLRRGWAVLHRSDPLAAPLALGIVAGLVAAIVTMGVERFIGRPLVQLFWVMAAVLVGLEQGISGVQEATPGRVGEPRVPATPAFRFSSRTLATDEPREFTVQVVGAVRSPGLYRLPEGSRVDAAIRKAGGPKPKAAIELIDLAALLADGQRVLVQLRGAVATGVVPVGTDSVAGCPGGKVDLNSAKLEELSTLPGIGPVIAQRILDYRTQSGGFGSMDELDAVPGIGPARLEQLRPLVDL